MPKAGGTSRLPGLWWLPLCRPIPQQETQMPDRLGIVTATVTATMAAAHYAAANSQLLSHV